MRRALGLALLLTPTSPLYETAVLPCFPFLVVMMITPFAALEPYREAAAASFNTVMDSISSGLMVLRIPMLL